MAESQPTTVSPAPVGLREEEPRLMISKIVCENFKSYAGVKELGPFHKCFTSIVGPNGSGKSNVIDSMLFVFGYRARKIRSKKVAVLIHNSEHHQNLTCCTVSVHFQKIIDQPGDAYTVVPGSEFVVSRTAHTDNSSYYQLNGKKVPFKEVATLLRGCGIDLDHNRFLILQGEVEQIALMKPKAQSDQDDGMLEFLEDIIGTSQFKEPIEVLAKKVDELNDIRGEKLNRVKAVEKEKNELEGAKNEAEHYLSLQRDMAKKQHSLYQRYIYECTQHETKALERKEELDGQVNELQTALKEHTVGKREKTKEQKKQFTAYEKLGEQDEHCREQMASCETRDVRARQDLKNTKTALKKTSKNLEKEREKLEELKAAPEKHRKEISNLEKKLTILERRKDEEETKLSEVMEGLKTATQGLQVEKEALELKLVDLNQTVNEAKSKLDVAQVEVDLYREQFTSKEKQLEEAKKNLATIKNSIKDKKGELTQVQSTLLPAKRRDLDKTDSELKVVRERAEKLSQQARSGRVQVEEARSSLQAHRSQGRVLGSLLEQKEQGTLPGIHGRLGDLGAIDEKYDIAISTACGPLNHIVVDTMDTAVKCVEFLRTNDIGVATFLSLDKIEHLRKKSASKITAPENVPRLYDLVRPKSDLFSTAFYFALRDTLVADSLDQATRIGLQGRTRHRVVTLEGQLIDVAGTMSGGGNKPLKGRMSSKLLSDVTPQQLAKLEEQLQSDEKAARDCTRRRAELEDHFKLLKSEIAVLEDQVKKDGRDLEVLQVQEKGVSERLKDLTEQCKGQKMDSSHLAGLEEQVKRYDKEHKKALSAANKVQTDVQRLHDQIMEVSGGRMQQQQAQVDAVRKDIDQTNAAITKANVAIKTAERNTKKCEGKIASLEKELQETETKRESLKEELTALEDEAKEVIQRQEELREKVKEYEGVLQQLKQEMEAIEAEEASVQSKLMDAKHELEKYALKLKENQQKIRHFQNEIKKLNLSEEESRELTEDQLAGLDKQSVEYEITVLEERLKQMTPNMAAIEEYKKKDAIHQTRLKELDGITSERNGARMEFESLRKRRLDEFMAGFSTITNKLKEMYQMITLGGDAELELVDSLDPFSEGIVFSVRPPKKSWKNISNLSGGEKTLSSLALVFALHHYKPSPLYVMDEIDAALDFKNVSIVAHYIKERTKNAQFIIISLRNNMFELADRLVGIYKTHDTTKSVTIDPYRLASGSAGAQPTASGTTGAPRLQDTASGATLLATEA